MDRVELSMARARIGGGGWRPERLVRTSQAAQPVELLERPS